MSDPSLKSKLESDSCLLHGEQLRALLFSDHISYGEVNSIVRSKGIFCCESEKFFTVPLLANSLLKPSEFVALLDASVSREQKPKEKPQKIVLAGEGADWIAALKSLDLEKIWGPFLDRSDVSFNKEPELRIEDTNTASISYVIDRADFSRDLLQREMQFEAKVTIKRHEKNLELEVVSMHTSKETDRLNSHLVRGVTGGLHAQGITKKNEPDKILFNLFDNKQRVVFLLKLAKNFSENKSDGKILDFTLKTNEAATMPDDPQIKWMEGKIKSIRMGGDDLSAVFLLSSEEYYECYFITRIDVQYDYTFEANTGTCLLTYAFQTPGKNQDVLQSEFLFWIDRLSHGNRVNPDSAAKIKNKISAFARRRVEIAMSETLSDS